MLSKTFEQEHPAKKKKKKNHTLGRKREDQWALERK